MFNNRCLC